MRTLMLLITVTLAIVSAPAFAETFAGRVIGVTDGDTVKVLDGINQEHKIRLAGIDAPERKQPFGQRSKQHLSDLVYGKDVEVEWHKQDRYKRLVGKIIIHGQDANLEMVESGLAWHYKKYQGEQSYGDRLAYARAEEDARKCRCGLWADPRPIEPGEWRKGVR
ncbi:MAG: thermonuclease family protein [Chloroflexota bacterium]